MQGGGGEAGGPAGEHVEMGTSSEHSSRLLQEADCEEGLRAPRMRRLGGSIGVVRLAVAW